MPLTCLSKENTTAQTLHWVLKNVEKGTVIFTDDFKNYSGLKEKGCEHATVNHSIGEYVRGEAHTNGVESFWAMLKRGYYGTYHKMSPKHLQKYLDEFACGSHERPPAGHAGTDKGSSRRTCRKEADLQGVDRGNKIELC